MARVPINNFGKGLNLTDSAESLSADVSVFLNGMIDRNGNNRRRPGDTEFADTSVTKAIISTYWWDEQSVVICVDEEGAVSSISEGGSVTSITGDDFRAGTKVKFASNGDTLYMVNGTSLNKLNAGDTTITQISDGDLPEFLNDVVILDNFIFVSELNSGRFYRSEPIVGSVDPTFETEQVYTAEFAPDQIQRLLSINGSLVILGRSSSELWRNSSDGSAVVRTSANSRGIEEKETLAQLGDDYIVLNSLRHVVNRNGDILNGAVLGQFSELSSTADAFAFIQNYKGNPHYVIVFPSADNTYAMDLKNREWIQWTEYTSGSGATPRWKAESYVHARKWNKHIIGHNSNGKLYELDDSKYVGDSSDIILFQKQIDNISLGTLNLKEPKKLILKFKAGKGIASALNTEATALVRYRIDGRDWTQPIAMTLYAQGDRVFESVIRRVRPFRLMDIEVVVADNVDFEWVGMEFDGTVLED
jgi:hypothetical protein